MTGEVYNMQKLENFSGTYVIGEAGVSLVKGASAEEELWSSNDNDVKLHPALGQ